MNMGLGRFRALRLYLEISSDREMTEYTGRLSKTIIYGLNRELELLRGLKGSFSPLHISPPFKPKGLLLGDSVYPEARKINGNIEYKPVQLDGEYVIHIGGARDIIDLIERNIRKHLNREITIMFAKTITTFKITAILDPTREIQKKTLTGQEFTLYLKAPAYLFNPFVPSRLKLFNTSAMVTLATPYHMGLGLGSITDSTVYNMIKTLGYVIEKWYTPRTIRTVQIPFKNKIEPALTGKISYFIDAANRTILDKIETTLKTAEILGIGASRMNGFGTITWIQK